MIVISDSAYLQQVGLVLKDLDMQKNTKYVTYAEYQTLNEYVSVAFGMLCS